MRRLSALLVRCCALAGLASVVAERTAHAAEPGSGALAVPTGNTEPTEDEPATRRSGVVVGTAIGYGLASANGYPNNATLIGTPAYHSSSNLMQGVNTSFLVMGALTDYVSFGFWLGSGTAQSSEWRSTSFGIGFRVEAFPLYRLFPTLRDLGLSTRLGYGHASLASKVSADRPSAVGAQSYIGGGVFYEFPIAKFWGGHLAGGPSLDLDVIDAASIDRITTMLSGRFVFYGGM
jgi:hypothetical protein